VGLFSRFGGKGVVRNVFLVVQDDSWAVRNDFSVVPNDFWVVQNDFWAVRNDFSVVPNDFWAVRNDFWVVPNDFSVVPNDFSVVQNDFLSRLNDFSVDRNPFSVVQNDLPVGQNKASEATKARFPCQTQAEFGTGLSHWIVVQICLTRPSDNITPEREIGRCLNL
jgi:hypothetical protein